MDNDKYFERRVQPVIKTLEGDYLGNLVDLQQGAISIVERPVQKMRYSSLSSPDNERTEPLYSVYHR